MAPSSKSERNSGAGSGGGGPGGAGGKRATGRRREHVLKQLERVKISGQLSPRLFRKLPPRVCVSLKNIVDEDFLYAGHIFLGFSKCGRYVLSYTSSSGDDDFSFYIYHLYWWEFNVHSKLKLVRQVRLFQDEEIYSDLYLTVCEWPSDASKVIVFGFNTRSANGMLMNMMMMSDENHRDIYISTVAVPPPGRCAACRDASRAHPGDPSAQCLRHGFMLHTKYQVVYPFPTFQPAFQLKKDQVVLLNTSYSLVACAVSVHSAGDSSFCQILYDHTTYPPAPPSPPGPQSPEMPPVLPPLCPEAAPARPSGAPEHSPAIAKAKEFVADIFRRAKEAKGGTSEEVRPPPCPGPSSSRCRLPSEPLAPGGEAVPRDSPLAAEVPASEPGYVNYTKLYYVLGSGEGTEPEDGLPPPSLPPRPAPSELEDDKISLPFVVTDLRGRNLRPMREQAAVQGQYLTVEQLTLDFEYVINEVIRHDATWGHQFCSFSDYDIVILEVCPETNQVLINIGLLLLAFPSPTEEGQLRPKTYHTSLKVAWDLNTGIFVTVSVGDLTEVKGQTSGSVWSSYRKSCVDMVMKWLVPESSGRYVNRMTNEALHKGCSLKVLADSERYTWIVL
ncbi:DDB1- and CUL4-associated factor 15 isoform X1 [Physeter macrocephalus]|uniref:DDB1- and CUL4-associated factor 15 isoform X1 n=1 Tax=Physeter macrocephalus TaxID=9755 RepID=A0A455AYT9_PHYMC|nr:DDB1- and CUL4-associated factor 15 isoform X1 [Physeter catodon]|eukprot:XP_028341038.1 DDB1- and CUL4-associated factor 15 isoform X1 [Physeter catodon]